MGSMLKLDKMLDALEQECLKEIGRHPGGISNADICRILGFDRYDPPNGNNRGWFGWSILQKLVREKKCQKNGKKYVCNNK